ncbi:hypothetical protein [Streptomyces collinus]|uniref:hypothetical protein n=1 Tax=Streptomyces collinus TaxID=42684 RepID=UPI003809A3F1
MSSATAARAGAGARTWSAAGPSDSRASVSRIRSAAAMPDWSAVMFWLSSLMGSIRPKA